MPLPTVSEFTEALKTLYLRDEGSAGLRDVVMSGAIDNTQSDSVQPLENGFDN